MYATGGLKKFFRVMALLLAVASVVGLLPLSALADEARKVTSTEQAPVNSTETNVPGDNEATRAGETTKLSENFDSMSSLGTTYSSTAWYAYNAGSGNNWTLNSSSSYAYSGSKSAQVQYSSSYAANCYLVSAPFTVDANMAKLDVSLYERVRSSSYAETFDVFFVKASDVTTLAGVASATKYTAISSASYTNITYAMVSGSSANQALAGQSVRLVVHCSSAADKYYLYIDDIVVTQTAASDPITVNFNVNTVVDNDLTATVQYGGTLTWPTQAQTDYADLSDYVQDRLVGWTDHSVPAGTSLANVTPLYYVNPETGWYNSPALTFDELAAYDTDGDNTVTFYAVFAEWDDSHPTTNISTGTTQNNRLSENFDNNFSLTNNSYSASGWYTYVAGTSTKDWQLVSNFNSGSGSTSNPGYHSSPYALGIQYDSSDDTLPKDCYLVSAPFTVGNDISSLDLSVFVTASTGSSYPEKFSVYFIKQSDIDTSTGRFNASALYPVIGTTTVNTNLSYNEYTASSTETSLKGQTVRVVIHAESDADKDWLIVDDVTVSETINSTSTLPAYTDGTYTSILEQAATPHTVTINYQYTDGTPAPASDTYTVNEGQGYSCTIEAPEGYTADPDVVSGTMGTEDITVTVTFSPAPFVVHYTADYPTSGSYTNDVTYYYGDAVTLPDNIQQFTGYTLVWTWHKDSATGETVEAPAAMPAYDLYAVGTYMVNPHTIAYYSNNELVETVNVPYGDTIEGIAAPERPGYVFDGWTYYDANDNVYTGSTMPDYDLTAQAQWHAAVTAVTVTVQPGQIEPEQTATATAYVTAGDGLVLGTDYHITWSVDDPTVAELVGNTADQTTVTLNALEEGVVTVTATVEDLTGRVVGTATLTVGFREFTVNFTVDGQTVYTESVVYGGHPSQAAFNAAYSLPAHTSAAASTWSANGSTYAYGDPFDENNSSTAIVDDITYELTIGYESYNVTFMSASGTNGQGQVQYTNYNTQTVVYQQQPANPGTPADFVDGTETYVFQGWIMSTDGGTTFNTNTVYTAANLPAIEQNTVFRAVYRNSAIETGDRVYTLVTEPADGQEYIVVDAGYDFAATNDMVGDYYLTPVGVTLTDFAAVEDYYCYLYNTTSEDEVMWTFTAHNGNWYVQDRDGNYMSIDNNGYLVVSATPVEWVYDESANHMYLAGNHTQKYLSYVGSEGRGRNTVDTIGYDNRDVAMPVRGTNQLLSENFDNNFTFTSGAYSASGWYAYNAGSGNNWQKVSTVTTSSSTYNFYNSASYGMYVTYSETDAMDCYLVSAPFAVSSNMTELAVSLYATNFGQWSEKFSVYFIKESDINTATGAFDTSSLAEAIGTTTLSSSLTFTEYEGSTSLAALKGQTVRVVIHGESDADMAYLIIDDITVTETVSDEPTPTGDAFYEPTRTVVEGEEYLIGYKDGSDVYLLMNYNPTGITNNYYYNNSSSYYGYAVKAVLDSNGNVIGVDPDTYTAGAVIGNTEWYFVANGSSYMIQSAAESSYYLTCYTSTTYNDCYPAMSWTSTSYVHENWKWIPENQQLVYNVSDSVTKYVSIYSSSVYSGSIFFGMTTDASSVQLYRKVENTGLGRRFTLNNGTTEAAGTIKLYGQVQQNVMPTISISPATTTLYWYDENVVQFDSTADVIQTVNLTAAVTNIVPEDIVSVTWSATGEGTIVTIQQDSDNQYIVHVEAAGLGTSTIEVQITDRFGNTYVTHAVVNVVEKELGTIPEHETTTYPSVTNTGSTVYKEVTSFVDGEDYIIVSVPKTSVTGNAYYYAYSSDAADSLGGNTYMILYNSSSYGTISSSYTMYALTTDGTTISAKTLDANSNYSQVYGLSDGTSINNALFRFILTSDSNNPGYWYYISSRGAGRYMVGESATLSFGSSYPWIATRQRYSSSYNYRYTFAYMAGGTSAASSLRYLRYSSGFNTYAYGSQPGTSSAMYNLYLYKATAASFTASVPATVKLAPGASGSAAPTINVGNANLANQLKVTYKTTNRAIAEVDANGNILAKNNGVCGIYVLIDNGVDDPYIMMTTVIVTADGTDNSGRYMSEPLSHGGGSRTVYVSGTETKVDALTMDGIEINPQDALVSADYILYDGETIVWTYEAGTSGGYLKNKEEGKYIYDQPYTTSTDSDATTYWMPTLSTSKTLVNYNGSSDTLYYTTSNGTFYGLNDYIYYTNNNQWDYWFTFDGTSSNYTQYRIFQRDDSIQVGEDITDNLEVGVDIFSTLSSSEPYGDALSQTTVIYNNVQPGTTVYLHNLPINLPAGAVIDNEETLWEIREQSVINGTPIVGSFDEENGTFTVNPALTGDWQGYVIVAYVLYYELDGVHYEVTNFGRINLSNGTYIVEESELPKFPDPGYVGLDKTATPNNFLNSGIGRVELSNFGIPTTKPVDVVLVLDISGSMTDVILGSTTVKMSKAKEAATQFANVLLEDSENRLAIVTFSSGASVITGDKTTGNGAFIKEGSLPSTEFQIDSIVANGGTNFDKALQDAYAIFYDSYKIYGDAHDRVVVFMTDGAPGYYNNMDLGDKRDTTAWDEAGLDSERVLWDMWCLGSNSSYYSSGSNYMYVDPSYTGSSYATYFSNTDKQNFSINGTNMYMDAIKADAGVTLNSSNFTNSTWVSAINAIPGVTNAYGIGAKAYSIGFDIASYGSTQINAVGVEGDECGLTGTSAAKAMSYNATNSNYYYDADANTDLTDVFETIAHAIRIAARNAVTTDEISEYFDLNVETGYTFIDGNNQTQNGSVANSNTIVVTRYTLDENYERDEAEVLETVTLTGTNPESNNYEAIVTGATSSEIGACYANGKINAKYFTYDIATKTFEWRIGDLADFEYALSYSVRLKDEYRIDGAAIYPTNTFADLDYINVNNYPVTQHYPEPELPWYRAQTYYEFYLVNEQGQPVNFDGIVVPFNQRQIVYTTASNPVRFSSTVTSVTFNAAELLALNGLAYTLYDENADYRVSVDPDYMGGSYALETNGTTYVTNLPGHSTPVHTAGNETFEGEAPVSTFVSFPVVMKLTINPDAIVIDYAMGVEADVTMNDILPSASAQALRAVGSRRPTSAELVTNGYGVDMTNDIALGYYSLGNEMTVTNAAGNRVLGTAKVQTVNGKNVVKFVPSQYLIDNPQVITLYCAVQASAAVTGSTRTTYLYEQLNIVPANVMYFDDSYFTQIDGAFVNGTYSWSVVQDGGDYGTEGKVQHTSFVNDTGRDDVHGYDAALADFDVHSFNGAHSVTVQEFTTGTVWPKMTFTFKGTGFEVVTDTMPTTGNIAVMVYNASGARILSRMVDSYYGTGNITQTPTVRVTDLDYGTYTVELSVVHNAFFASLHEKDPNKADTTVTIDAIRVFEPIQPTGTELGYYKQNKQAYPVVTNIKDIVIDSVNLTAHNGTKLYKYENGSFTEATEVESGAQYVIYNETAGKVLALQSGALVSLTATVSGSSITVADANNVNEYLWIFTESEVENEFIDEDDDYARYTVKNAGANAYLTINTGANVEYGELGVTNTVASAASYMNQWTYDGLRLITGPMQIIQDEGENAVQFRNIYYALGHYGKFQVITSVAPGKAESNAEVNALLHFDGGTTADPELYKAIGPNNEVYVLPGSALAFQFVSDVEPAGVYLELQAPYGNDVSAYLYSRAAGQPANPSEMIGTASGMYYSITDKLNWSYSNTDGKYHSGAFIVYNGSNSPAAVSNPIDYILAIANVKFTYNEASRGTRFAGISSVEYTRVVDSIEKLEWKLYSPLFDLDVHTAAASNTSNNGTGISRFNEAYMTVTTSTDVSGLIVRDGAGNIVKIKAAAFTDNGDTRTWTITIDRTGVQSYNVYVTTVSTVFDMRNPVSCKVKVPSQIVNLGPGSGLRPIA